MPHPHLISFVIPAWNEESVLGATIWGRRPVVNNALTNTSACSDGVAALTGPRCGFEAGRARDVSRLVLACGRAWNWGGGKHLNLIMSTTPFDPDLARDNSPRVVEG
jgi:hypothetical protein